jgi:predicted lysophospholipase L1 biosynthesis ABC-type transport system permease subunit
LNGVRLVRCSIAVTGGVVIGHLVFKLGVLLLHAALTPMLGPPDTWPGTIATPVVLGALLLGLRVAYGLGRRLWPERTFQEIVKAREAAAAD